MTYQIQNVNFVLLRNTRCPYGEGDFPRDSRASSHLFDGERAGENFFLYRRGFRVVEVNMLLSRLRQ